MNIQEAYRMPSMTTAGSWSVALSPDEAFLTTPATYGAQKNDPAKRHQLDGCANLAA
jgi:hypothetical protein